MRPFVLPLVAVALTLFCVVRDVADLVRVERLVDLGRAGEAEIVLQQQMVRWERVAGPRNLAMGLLWWNLGYRQIGTDPQQALESLARARSILGDVGPDSVIAAGTMTTTGSALDALKRWPEAEWWMTRALHIREEQLGPDTYLTRRTRRRLAVIWIDTDPAKAEQTFERLLEEAARNRGGLSERSALLANLGTVRLRIGDVRGAVEVQEEALRLQERLHAPEDVSVRRALGRLLLAQCGAGLDGTETQHRIRGWYERRAERIPRTYLASDPCRVARK